MLRIMITFIALVMFLTTPLGLKSCFAEDIAWKITGLDKPSGQTMIGPNGLLYIFSGNKTTLVDADGKKIQEITVPGNSIGGTPVFGPQGTLFYPGSNSVQQILANGKSGWKLAVQENKAKSTPLLSAGPQNLLYLPLPTALYAIDVGGHYKWHMVWDSTEANRTKVDTKREILACVGNNEYLFVVYGVKNTGYTLAAINAEGKIAWRYSLGSIKDVHLLTVPERSLYVTVNPAKIDRMNKGKIYLFKPGEKNSPSWTFSVSLENLTTPTLSEDGQLFFCASEYLFNIDTSNGKEIWRQKLLKAISRPAVDNTRNQVYLGTDDNRLLTVNSEGRLKRDIELDSKVTFQPLVTSSGELYVLTDKGTLYKINDSSSGGD